MPGNRVGNERGRQDRITKPPAPKIPPPAAQLRALKVYIATTNPTGANIKVRAVKLDDNGFVVPVGPEITLKVLP